MGVRIAIEESTKPWFGPRKRAREFLRNRNDVLTAAEACNRIAQLAGRHRDSIQRIRFIDFRHRDENDFRYTIALVWTFSDASLRNWLYDNAAIVVAETGWYPLPQGERIGSRLADLHFEQLRVPNAVDMSSHVIGGPLQSLVSAVDQDGGCSIRCGTATGSILLDTGLPGKLTIASTDRISLLTHSHLDHSGNVRDVIRSGRSVIMSKVTARILIALGRITATELQRSCFVLVANQEVSLGEGVTMRSFAVPHCSGSLGFVVFDGRTTLVYPGDVTFRTARHDAIPAILQQLESGLLLKT